MCSLALRPGWVGTLQWRPVSLSAAHHEQSRIPSPDRAVSRRPLAGAGASDNTVSSYRTDLEKFALWLDEQGGSLLLAGLDDIQHYLAWRVDHQFAASSTARFLSALRRFYQYLNREKLRSDDPTVLLEGPKLPKSCHRI